MSNVKIGFEQAGSGKENRFIVGNEKYTSTELNNALKYGSTFPGKVIQIESQNFNMSTASTVYFRLDELSPYIY